ncbi:GYD domain-containing protein [Dongia soli]|uniref:GYD domain-containing protein n=1 Tax=Dongia soli TaxID=600628 RepID=A0ABU5EEB4_9PROT|nr:GYD domain-containing protein [Dongia soli]MDY0884695.1 GYD domain-containing protein [Dongia soli]
MGYYLLQWKYKDAQVKRMISKPHNRQAMAAKAIEPFGGKLHSFFFAFGPVDGVAIVEYPDNESAAAGAMLIAGADVVESLSTTVLLTSAEAEQAMRRAGTTRHSYSAMPE